MHQCPPGDRAADEADPYADNRGITVTAKGRRGGAAFLLSILPENHAQCLSACGKAAPQGGEGKLDLLDRVNETKLPFAELLGIEFVSASPERIVAQMTVRQDLCTVPAVLHGGAIMAFADTLGAMGTIVNLPQGAGTTTIESKTNFVAPAPVGSRVIGETTPVHRGRRTMIWQTRVSTSEGRLVALVTQTQLVL
jgi:uncharacterized protein (TIGR00369 family)